MPPNKKKKKFSKIWGGDPGSGKNLFRIPDTGVKKAPDPGSRIRIRNTDPGRYNLSAHTEYGIRGTELSLYRYSVCGELR
jgi:hypothetical protein